MRGRDDFILGLHAICPIFPSCCRLQTQQTRSEHLIAACIYIFPIYWDRTPLPYIEQKRVHNRASHFSSPVEKSILIIFHVSLFKTCIVPWRGTNRPLCLDEKEIFNFVFSQNQSQTLCLEDYTWGYVCNKVPFCSVLKHFCVLRKASRGYSKTPYIGLHVRIDTEAVGMWE